MTIVAPFAEYACQVPDAFIDYNGHMNDAAYAQVLTDANELFLDALGMSADYRNATGCALYTVEMNIRFLREVSRGDALTARTLLTSHDDKRIRVGTTIIGSDGQPVATGDSLYLHVDTAKGGVVNVPPDRAEFLRRVQDAHDAVSDR